MRKSDLIGTVTVKVTPPVGYKSNTYKVGVYITKDAKETKEDVRLKIETEIRKQIVKSNPQLALKFTSKLEVTSVETIKIYAPELK